MDPTDGPIDFYFCLLEDRERGRERTLEDYLAAFPDQSAEIEAFFADAGSADSPASRYLVETPLGVGGQGTVYRARDLRLGRPVALKRLRELPSEHERARLAREAEIVSQLDHPGLCEVFDVDVEGGVPFIAMKLVPGRPLAHHLRDAAALPPPLTEAAPRTESAATRRRAFFSFLAKAARALHAAHGAGIVHRDVKPGNLMVTPDGDPVVLDFGLARSDAAEGPRLSMTGTLFGTPDYMSPEQVAGRPLDARTDVWALGVILCEGLSGERPFTAPTREGLLAAIESREPRLPRGPVSRDLRAVIDTALAKDPERRYQSAAALASDLEALAEGTPPAARPVSRSERLRRWVARHPAPAAAILMSLVLVGVAGYLAAVWPEVRKNRAAEHRLRTRDRIEQAYLELEERHFERALREFEALRPHAATFPEILIGLAQTRLERREPERVLALVDAETGAGAHRPGMARLRLAALRDSRRKEEAEALAATLRPPQDPMDHLVAGMLEMRRGHRGEREAWRRAHAHFTQAALSSSSELRIHQLRQAKAAGESGDADLAKAAAEAVTRRWPDSPLAWHAAGYALSRHGADREGGIAAFRQAIALRSEFAVAWNNLGNALKAVKRWEDAEAAYRRALELFPEQAQYHRNLGLLLARTTRPAESLASFRRAAELAPRDPTILVMLGQSLYYSKLPDEAFASYEAAARLDPDHHLARHNLGVMLANRGRLEEAETHLRHALSVRNDNLPTHYQLARVLLLRDRLAEATRHLDDLLARNARHVPAHHLRALVARKEDRPEDAMAIYRHILEIAPRDRRAPVHLARLLLTAGRPGEALALLEKRGPEKRSREVEALMTSCREALKGAAGEQDRSR